MPNCKGCGAPITHAQTEDGTPVALETHVEPTGDQRYTVVRFGPPLIVKRIPADNTTPAWADHAVECPHGSNGL
jgi:hypothetical protein